MIGKNGVSLLIGHNGVQDKTTLNPANETVARGIYDATTLSAVDAELATANIKNGITIFGFAGSADVFDISDATAVEAEVLSPETFYAVAGGIRTGTMPTVALAAGANAYPAGYHAGAASLTAVDGDLVTGSIKFGVTIFGVTGHTDVRDSTDANLTAPEAPTGKTFYAGGGARKTGSGTKTLNPANENVLAGYYAATTLSAVDIHLAAANILSGVNIFGFVGVATVQDIADADAAVGDVKDPRTFYSVTGARKTGTMPTVALAPGSSAYPAGYHAGDGGGLPAIDADLVTANIKNGITIFNVAGHVDVRNVSDANALVGEVMAGRTFYAVGGAIKTGTLATVALAADNTAYPAGYHAGAASLQAVDAHLTVANIKTGVNIFGYVGTYDTTGSPIAAGRMRTGDVGWANGVQITGTGTKTLNPANENVLAGYYAATTLSAVDIHLAAANIKQGVTIFGFLGTFVSTLAEDALNHGENLDIPSASSSVTIWYEDYLVTAGADQDLATCTTLFDANSIAVGSGFCHGMPYIPDTMKLRLYMGGVEVAESDYWATGSEYNLKVIKATRALSGNQITKIALHNYNAGDQSWRTATPLHQLAELPNAVAVGSIKLV